MKAIILSLLIIATGSAQVPLEDSKSLVVPPPFLIHAGTGSSPGMKFTLPVAYLSIQCGSGAIKIEYATGKVTLPEGVDLDDAAKKFWKAVADAFPEARREIIGDNRTVEWKGNVLIYGPNGRPMHELGLRYDGVVVWREIKK